MAAATKDIISIPRAEYTRLKKLDTRFRDLFAYMEHIAEIREARKDVRSKKLTSQEALFRRLGL